MHEPHEFRREAVDGDFDEWPATVRREPVPPLVEGDPGDRPGEEVGRSCRVGATKVDGDDAAGGAR
jgi:hypothetical protein